MASDSGVFVDAGGPIATVTIDRPKVLNALDEVTLRELGAAFAGLAGAAGLRCVIVTGAGPKAFVAGADISAMSGLGPRDARAFAELGHELGDAIEALPVPVIAAVGGFALGAGCELALACDFIYASSAAKFGQPEVNLGVIPGFGGTQRLARRVGLGMARELVYTGAIISAAEALRIGLVNAVVEPADLMDHTLAYARDMALNCSPSSLAAIKREVWGQLVGLTVEEATAMSDKDMGHSLAASDFKEGVASFLEKRPPNFAPLARGWATGD